MPYRVTLKRVADRDLDRLTRETASQVAQTLRALAIDPRPPGTVKLRGSRNHYRLRVGDYRILYEVDDAARTVTIARVRHRREVYRDL